MPIRILSFVLVASLASFLMLWSAVNGIYSAGAVPQLRGYCCEYCENGTACVRGATGDGQARKAVVCAEGRTGNTTQGVKLPVPIEPWDTWSNVAYLVVALLPLAHHSRFKGFAPIFTTVGLILGFGSGLFHASGTRWAQHADVFGMFVVFGFLAAVSVLILVDKLNVALLVCLTAALTCLEFFLRSTLGDVVALGAVAVTIVLPLSLSSLGQPHRRRILWVILIFVVAIVFRQLDGLICEIAGQHSLIQGHAIWHVVSAFGCGPGIDHGVAGRGLTGDT